MAQTLEIGFGRLVHSPRWQFTELFLAGTFDIQKQSDRVIWALKDYRALGILKVTFAISINFIVNHFPSC